MGGGGGQVLCFGCLSQVFEQKVMDQISQPGQCQKIVVGFSGGAPNTHTSAHHGPEKVLLDT